MRPVRRALGRADIPVWCVTHEPMGEYLMFSVPEAQAIAAIKALEAAGIAVLSGPAWALGGEQQRGPNKHAFLRAFVED